MKYLFKITVFLTILANLLYAGDTLLTLTEDEQKYLQQRKTIKYIADPKWLPYEAYDEKQQHIGIIPDILKLIEKKIDVKFETLYSNSWEETLILANKNKVCMLSSDPADEALKEKFIPSTPYLKNPIVIIMKNNSRYIAMLEFISHKKIAVVRDYGYVAELKLAYPNINFIYVDSVEEGLIGVSKGKHDVFLASVASASYNISKHSLNNLTIVGRTVVDMKISFFTKKEDKHLLSILNKAISNFTEEEMHNILNRWAIVEFAEKIDYALIVKIVLTFFFLLFISFIWNRNMKKSKEEIKKLNKELKEKIDELEILSVTDGMTGLYNRRHFDKIFTQEINRAKRNKHNLIVSMFDVDHFKQYNDTYGHDKGDTVLIEIAKVMKAYTKRANDFAFRVGGEEFYIISSDMDEQKAYNYIESLRRGIENIKIIHEHNSASKYVTASFGLIIISYEELESLDADAIYKIADDALYQAKESGRNKITKEVIISR